MIDSGLSATGRLEHAPDCFLSSYLVSLTLRSRTLVVFGKLSICIVRVFLMTIIRPPFTLKTAIQKVRGAEDLWNSCDPEKVSLGYSADSYWRNRSEFITGRGEIVDFLRRKWVRELEYRLIKELWTFSENRIAVRFAYEWHDDSGNWYRSYGNENWEFDHSGLNKLRYASINDLPIKSVDRKYHWQRSGARPLDHPGLSDLGL